MNLFMDVHRDLAGLTASSFIAAHVRALARQEHAGVRYLHHWYDDRTGTAFCLVEAPNAAAVFDVHRRSHGNLPDEVLEVVEAPDTPSERQSANSP